MLTLFDCSGIPDYAGSLPEGELPRFQACSVDADRTVARNSCCCGTVAINADQLEAFVDARGECEFVCALDCGVDPKTAVCTAGRCAVVGS